MKKYLLVFLMTILTLTACASQSSTLTGSWKLVAYGPLEAMTPAVSDADANLTFGDDGTVGGNSGCNSLGGEYQVEGNVITFGELTSTLMACDEARTAQESAFTQVLNGDAEFEIEDETLAITKDGMALVFSSVPAK